jgi:taspase (threonine aspartase 1)
MSVFVLLKCYYHSSNVQVLTPLDTVGAVCVDAHGNLAAACSSGGVALKHPGRVGQVSLSVIVCV